MAKPQSTIEYLKRSMSSLGYTFREYSLSNELFTEFIAPNGDTWITNNDKVYYPFSSIGAKLISKSKILSNEMVTQLGGNLPLTYEIHKSNNNDTALQAIINEGRSLIVKPYDSTLSNGLTTDITTVDALQSALGFAYEYSNTALVQEQVYGDDVRFMIIDGKVEGVILRQTPRIIGDGVSTVAELIVAENGLRSKVQLEHGMRYRELTDRYIDESFVTSQEVLADGEIKELSREVLVRRGASAYNITEEIHPSYAEEIEKIANHLGKGILAVDVIIKDYTQPNNGSNYWFLEFNSSPVIALCYCIRDANHFDILSYLGPMLDRVITTRLFER